MTETKHHDTIIIGGGIAGLTAGYELLKAKYEVKADRPEAIGFVIPPAGNELEIGFDRGVQAVGVALSMPPGRS